MTVFAASCFGKLPVHADFIRHNAGPEILSLDSFLGEGMLRTQKKLAQGWTQAYAAMPPLRFIRFIPDRKRFVVGAMVPSRGKANREFPFFIACVVDAGAVRGRPAILPMACDAFLGQAEALARSDWSGLSLRDVQTRVGALSAEFDPRTQTGYLDQLLSATTYAGLINGLGAWDDRRLLLLHNMANLLGPKSRPKFMLVLPPCESGAHVSLWLDMTCAARGASDRFPQLAVWSSATPAVGLRFALGDPTELFASLLLPHVENDACELYQEGLESASLLEKAKARFGQLASDPQVSATQILAGLKAAIG